MFRLQPEPRWTWPVIVHQPEGDGSFVERRFKAVWRLVPKADREQLSLTEEGSDELMRRSIVELQDLADEAGNPIPHSAELVDQLLGIPWIRRGLIQSYAGALTGVPSAAAVGN